MLERANYPSSPQLYIVEGKPLEIPGNMPEIVLRSKTLPDPTQFLLEERVAVQAIMPQYHGSAPTDKPKYLYPKSFAEMKAHEKAWQNFTIAYKRTPQAAQAFDDRKRFLTENNIDISEFMRKTIFEKGDQYVLRLDEFPANLPDGVEHYNIWLARDDFSPDEKTLIVLDCMHTLGIYDPKDVLLNEKKWRARFSTLMHEGEEYQPGVKPSVEGIEHFHFKVNRNG